MTDYEGKTAVVTGGTSGIGLATARMLGERGARVLVTGRTPASLEKARATLGPEAVVVENDAVSGIDALAERAAAELGTVDLLVLNAGGTVGNAKGIATTSVYSATKAALRSLTRVAARELIDRGIRVNAVSPGPVDTGILERTMSAEDARRFLEQIKATNPTGRFGEPEEVAKAIIYLGFEATYTTGTELLVDGGASEL